MLRNPVKTVIWTILFIVIGILIYDRLVYWRDLQNTRIGRVTQALSANIAQMEDNENLVIFMGSSRFHSAIDVDELTLIDGNRQTVFLNLAQSSIFNSFFISKTIFS